jgi:cold shock CspA family protein
VTIDTATRHQGVVKWFGGRLGNFGFIKANDGSEEMFVHISAFGKAGLREIKATGWNTASKSTRRTAGRALSI